MYFANGKVKVDPQYNSPLLALTQKAQTIEGYMIEVKGFASSSGSAALNQEAERRPRKRRDQHPDSAGSRSTYENAGTGGDG